MRTLVVYVYVTFATDVYTGNVECYGNLTDKFQSCAPDTDVVLRIIDDECTKHDPKDRLAFKAVFGALEEHNETLGVAWSLPDHAVRHEMIGCQGHLAGTKRWHIVVALYQGWTVGIPFMHTLVKEHPVTNVTIPLLDQDKFEHLWPILFGASMCMNVVSFSIIVLATFLLYKLRTNIRQKGIFGIYLKAVWFFVPNGAEKELNSTLVDIEHLLYTGPNSRVYFARYRFSERDYRNAVVPSRDAFQLCHIEAEMRINAQLRHPRVVEYIGFYRDAFGDVRIVSEFMAGGDLHTFLASPKNPITVGLIFNFIAQIAEGMEYLISRQLIHRDLAARNCMLDREYSQLKIADFGLSRQFNTDATYASTSPVKLPLRWMPPECFDVDGEMLRNCNFNELTDVWSFGVVMWECFARGVQPYGCQEFKEVMVHLKKGNEMRLAQPEYCPKAL